MTGSDYERELVRRLSNAGWAAMRCPTSGGGTDRDLPDVLALHETTIEGVDWPTEKYCRALAVELKSGKDTTLYADTEEVEALRRFALRAGATPLLGCRSTQQTTPAATYLLHPSDARMTDSGTYGLPVAECEHRAAWIATDAGVERV